MSDSEAELVAACAAGIGHVVMSVRPGNAPLTSVGREFPIVHSLLQLSTFSFVCKLHARHE